MELTIFKPSFVVLTMNGGEYFIDEKENQALMCFDNSKMFVTKKGVSIRVSTITEVLPMAEYYKAYPDKRPENTNYYLENVNDLDKLVSNYAPDRKLRAMQNIVKGFKQHFEGREIPKQSQEMLDKMITRLSNLKV